MHFCSILLIHVCGSRKWVERIPQWIASLWDCVLFEHKNCITYQIYGKAFYDVCFPLMRVLYAHFFSYCVREIKWGKTFRKVSLWWRNDHIQRIFETRRLHGETISVTILKWQWAAKMNGFWSKSTQEEF